MPIASAGPGPIAAAVRAVEQPISTEIKMLDGVFIKSMVVRDAGIIIPQHSHRFSHVSVLARGSVRVVAGGGCQDFTAPCGITIEAGIKHIFQTLTSDVIILCVHDIGAAEGVEILEEHQIVGA